MILYLPYVKASLLFGGEIKLRQKGEH